MEKKFFSRRLNLAQKFVLLLTLIFMTGCVSHVKELRDAQNQFNTAATLENQLKSGSEQDVIWASSQINGSYQLTLTMLSNLIKAKRSDLQRDNLLGTAYTLKAYAEWRLGDYEAAVKTSSEALSSADIILSHQDLPLMMALRGLIKNDQAYFHMSKKNYPFNDVKILLEEAVDDIQKALSTVEKNSNVRMYLVLSELAALKNWADLRGEPSRFAKEIPQDFNKRDEIADWCESAVSVWKSFTEEIEQLKPEDAPGLIHDWGIKLGMPETCEQ